MTDPIADMLTRIRNGLRVRLPSVDMPFSKTKETIAKILANEGWVRDVQVIEDGEITKTVRVMLKYDEKGESKIRSLRRISKPGQRVYVGKEKLPKVLGGMGIAILSTSSGIMTNRHARKAGVGGEVLCEVF